MENAQIEVQYYNPSSTKAPHNVKATDGKTYKFWPGSSADNVFNAQSVGKTYVVEYKEEHQESYARDKMLDVLDNYIDSGHYKFSPFKEIK